VKGPLQILRQLWIREQSDLEVRTTYQYVVDLRNRLEKTWEMVYEKLRKHQVIPKRQFDYRANDRTFKHGDLVLILLPTSDNKMLMQWRGPFKVLERVEGADYRIQVGHKQKMFHANLLKRYLTAEPESPEGTSEPADPTENESETMEVQAVLWEKVENLKDQGTELETLNSLQKQTVKDVKGHTTWEPIV